VKLFFLLHLFALPFCIDRTFHCGKMSGEQNEAQRQKVLNQAKLQVKVLEARALHGDDFGGTSDPYVEVRIRNEAHSYKTKVLEKASNPVWNEEFNIGINNPDSDALIVKVYDRDSTTSDDLLGELEFNIAALINKPPHEEWKSLQERTGPSTFKPAKGELKLFFSYTNPAAQQQPVATHVPPPQTVVPPQQTYVPPPQTVVPPQQTVVPPQQTYVQPQQTYVPPPQTVVPPQQHVQSPPPQATYPPQQATYPPQQATFPPQQVPAHQVAPQQATAQQGHEEHKDKKDKEDKKEKKDKKDDHDKKEKKDKDEKDHDKKDKKDKDEKDHDKKDKKDDHDKKDKDDKDKKEKKDKKDKK
jgi:hypothetical protein